MAEHSPLPWVLVKKEYGTRIGSAGNPDRYIPLDSPWREGAWGGDSATPASEANAAYIVQACNAFPDLVKALESIACFNDESANEALRQTGSYGSFDEPYSVKQARAALAKAKGEAP